MAANEKIIIKHYPKDYRIGEDDVVCFHYYNKHKRTQASVIKIIQHTARCLKKRCV